MKGQMNKSLSKKTGKYVRVVHTQEIQMIVTWIKWEVGIEGVVGYMSWEIRRAFHWVRGDPGVPACGRHRSASYLEFQPRVTWQVFFLTNVAKDSHYTHTHCCRVYYRKFLRIDSLSNRNLFLEFLEAGTYKSHVVELVPSEEPLPGLQVDSLMPPYMSEDREKRARGVCLMASVPPGGFRPQELSTFQKPSLQIPAHRSRVPTRELEADILWGRRHARCVPFRLTETLKALVAE